MKNQTCEIKRDKLIKRLTQYKGASSVFRHYSYTDLANIKELDMSNIQLHSRRQIVDEMMRACPNDSVDDHYVIGEAILRGENLDTILDLPECDRWPDTYSWLKTVLK